MCVCVCDVLTCNKDVGENNAQHIVSEVFGFPMDLDLLPLVLDETIQKTVRILFIHCSLTKKTPSGQTACASCWGSPDRDPTLEGRVLQGVQKCARCLSWGQGPEALDPAPLLTFLLLIMA